MEDTPNYRPSRDAVSTALTALSTELKKLGERFSDTERRLEQIQGLVILIANRAGVPGTKAQAAQLQRELISKLTQAKRSVEQA